MPGNTRLIDTFLNRSEITIPHDACLYLGHYCYADTVSNYMRMTESQFISHMKMQYPGVTSHALAPGEIESWKRSYQLIRKAFEDAPHSREGIFVS